MKAPGIHEMTHAEYLAETDSLSSSGARKLLAPSCPALFAYERANPPASTHAMDIGSCAHDMVLGGGPEIVRVEAESWRTNKAKDIAEEARSRGAVPILAAEHDQVKAIAASIRAHPMASRLFADGAGSPEAALFWRDPETGAPCRARLDWLTHKRGGRIVVPDLKSCRSAQKDEFTREVLRYKYFQQADFHLRGVKALGLADDPVFVFVAVEKTPPYLVNVIQLDVVFMRIGAAMNRRAIDTFAACERTGNWPGYSAEVELASPPIWFERQHETEMELAS